MGDRGTNLNGRLCQLVEDLVDRGISYKQARREFERRYLVETLRRHDGNLTRAAATLGIHRNTLRNKLSTLKVGADDYQTEG